MTGKTIDWQKINRNLPYAKTPAQLARRRGLWRAMDVNDNGFLSLAEVTRGVRDVLALQEIFNCRPAVNAAFHHCRDIHKWVGPLGDMEKEFEAIDTNHGGYILFSEFLSWASNKNLDIEDDIDELVD